MGRSSQRFVRGSSWNEVVGWLVDSLKVTLRTPPKKGQANESVVALFIDNLGVDPSSIAGASGHESLRQGRGHQGHGRRGDPGRLSRRAARGIHWH
jgi:hypothetical protein